MEITAKHRHEKIKDRKFIASNGNREVIVDANETRRAACKAGALRRPQANIEHE